MQYEKLKVNIVSLRFTISPLYFAYFLEHGYMFTVEYSCHTTATSYKPHKKDGKEESCTVKQPLLLL